MPRFVHVATAVSLATASLALSGTRTAFADANAPICAQTYGKSDGLSCNYTSYEQCRAFVSGLGGSCINNPYFSGAQNQVPRARVRR